jgi:putative protease
MEEKEVGKIIHYFGKISVGIIELTDTLRVGDTIHIKGVHDDFTQKVDSIQIEHEQIQEARTGESIGIKVKDIVHEHDKVYKVLE